MVTAMVLSTAVSASRQRSARQARKARTAGLFAELRHRPQLKLERFLVTALLTAQLSLTIIAPAVIKGTQPQGLILAICACAIAGALYVEAMTFSLQPAPAAPLCISVGAARFVLIVGIVAAVGSTLAGRGSYAVQIGVHEESPIVALLSPFATWLLFGTALYMWLYRTGSVSRIRALQVFVIACAVQLFIGIERAIMGQAFAFIAALIVMAIVARLIRFRTLIVLLLLFPILWPPLYEYRNALRSEVTGSSARVGVDDPFERLQMDEQMAQADLLRNSSVELETPSPSTLVRTGLLPRAIDPDRDPIDTGTQLNVALGGSATSATSATMMGNVYIFGGLLGVAAAGGALASGMRVALQRNSPWALSFVGLIYLYGMSFNATYPDVIPKLLQAATSMVLAWWLVRTIGVAHTKPRTRG